jgi:hypothetical protein
MVSDRAFRTHETRVGYRLFEPLDLTTWQAEDLLGALDQLGRTFLEEGNRTPGLLALDRHYEQFDRRWADDPYCLPPGYRLPETLKVSCAAGLSGKTKALAVTRLSRIKDARSERVRMLLISCDGYLVELLTFGPEETVVERGEAWQVRLATDCRVAKAGDRFREDLEQDLSLLPRIAGDLERLAKLWQVEPAEQRLLSAQRRHQILQSARSSLGPIDRYSRHE